MKRLRISAISYLNTAPLMWDFESGKAGSGFEISYTLPSQCAANLRDGTADIGIIPAAAYATVPGLVVIPGVAIASRQAVRSILLVSSCPLEDIKTVALDSSSMTSVALTKVLFAKWRGGPRTYKPMASNLKKMLSECDAALVIGDPALKIDRSRFHTLDLAQEWIRHTGKPFVFAFWAVRRQALKDAPSESDLAAIFQDSRDHGLSANAVDQIAKLWAPRLRLNESEIKKYLTENIYYRLDQACLEGLHLFYRYAQEYGALPAHQELKFIESIRCAAI